MQKLIFTDIVLKVLVQCSARKEFENCVEFDTFVFFLFLRT